MTLVLGVTPVALIYLSSGLLDAITRLSPEGRSRSLPTEVVVLLALLIGGNLVSQLLQRVLLVVRELFAARFANRVQWLIAQKAASVDLAQFEEATFHNSLRTAAEEASFRPVMVVDTLLSVLATLVTLASVSLVLLLWQPWAVPLLLAASCATLWASAKFGAARVAMIERRAEAERMRWYLFTLLTSEEGSKEVRLFNLQRFLLTRFQHAQHRIYTQDRKLLTSEFAYTGAAGLLATLMQGFVSLFTALQAFRGLISVGEFNLYYQSVLQLESQSVALMQNLGTLHEGKLFSQNLLSFLALDTPDRPRPRDARASPPKSALAAPAVRFEGVSFSYPNSSKSVLKDVSFEVRPGEAVALVGENGVGKSTLIKLLAGLYAPTAGHIYLDEKDSQTLESAELQGALSVAFQDFATFHFPLYENVGLGKLEELQNLELIKRVARRSGLDKVVERLPEGYHTVLGRFWERGHELSGGQKQLVAVTRALLRDAPILVLDEPSAALDVYTEQRLFQELLADREGHPRRTVIFISHRLTTVRQADRILVFREGSVAEQGTHDELAAKGGLYAQMIALQTALPKRSPWRTSAPPS